MRRFAATMSHQRFLLPIIAASTVLLLQIPLSALAVNPSMLWVKTWGGSNNDHASAVAVDGSDNAYVTGSAGSFSLSTTIVLPSGFLLKYDLLGNLLWQKVWGNGSDYWFDGEGAATDSKNGIYVVGENLSSTSPSPRLLLFKFDANGTLLWQRMWGGLRSDSGFGVAIGPSDKVYAVGYTLSFGAGIYDAVLLTFAPNGTLIRQVTWGGPRSEWATGVSVDPFGNVYLAGWTLSYGISGYNLFLLKFDPQGNLAWHRTWGPTSFDGSPGYKVATDSRGDIYVVGRTNAFGAGLEDAFILKFNSTGNLLWQRTWGGSSNDIASDVAVDSLGRIDVVGSTQSFNGGNSCYSPPCSDAFMITLDQNGTIISQNTWGGANDDAAYGVAADSRGSVSAAGAVREPPPYSLGSGNNTLGIPNINATDSGNDTLGYPTFRAVSTGIVIRSVSGDQNYSGLNNNAFLFKYGTFAPSALYASPSVFVTGLTVCLALALRQRAGRFRFPHKLTSQSKP